MARILLLALVAWQSVSAFTFRARLPGGGVPEVQKVFKDHDKANLTGQPSGGQVTSDQKHSALLSDSKFWWLACVFVLAIGVMIVRYDSNSDAKADESLTQDIDLRANVCGHFLLCFLGLNVSMIFWGISQEFMMDLATARGENTTDFALFLVMCNRLTTSVLTGMILYWRGKPFFFVGFQSACWPGLSNVVASWSQYACLSYISFTLQTTSKSARLLPVFLISVWRGKSYNIQDYAEVCIISAAVFVFGVETVKTDVEHEGTAMVGILLLAVNLCADSITPHLQDSFFKRYDGIDAMQATFAGALSSFLCVFAVLCCLGELPSLISFVLAEPAGLLHMMALCISSATTQYLISYTVKHFGPVVFTLIATSRQVLSVAISSILFHHNLSFLAAAAMFLVFGTLITRSMRALVQLRKQQEESKCSDATSPHHAWEKLEWHLTDAFSRHSLFLLCLVSIFLSLNLQGITQEFINVHTFGGKIFKYPAFLLACYKTTGFFIAVSVGWAMNGRSKVWHPDMRKVLLPAVPRDLATYLNYKAIFIESFPALMMLKSLKVLPTMAFGSLMKNRRYSFVDYMEATLVTLMVSLFVLDFHSVNAEIEEGESPRTSHAATGICLMLGVVLLEAFSNNLEDTVYQASSMTPAQLMTGLEMVSAIFFWPVAVLFGEVQPGLDFIRMHPEFVQYILLLGLFSAVGSYACTFTVRSFGPAILSCVLVARQLLGLVLSVGIFMHQMSWLCGVCLVSVSALVLASGMRQIETEMTKQKNAEPEKQKQAVKTGEAQPAGAGPLLENLGKSMDEKRSLEKSAEDSK